LSTAFSLLKGEHSGHPALAPSPISGLSGGPAPESQAECGIDELDAPFASERMTVREVIQKSFYIGPRGIDAARILGVSSPQMRRWKRR
jgi:hypothetical protein